MSLKIADIFNTISLKYNSDTTSQDDSLKSIACIPYLDDLLQERGSIGYGDYSLLSFYYIPEITRILNKRFNRPIDLLKYWSFAGPCIEEHPSIEDYKKND